MQELMEQYELSQFPALPEVLARLIQALNNESLNLDDLTELVLHDAAMTMKILAVANSSFYNRRNSVSSVTQGINLLGLKLVKMIAISASMHQFLAKFSDMTPSHFGRYWQHSLMTANLAKAIAQSIHYPNPDEAYLAGLLHDIGQLALWSSKHDAYQELLEKHKDEDSLIEQETSRFGTTHCELGAELAERWNMEPLLADAIRYHHEATAQVMRATELVKIVNAANALSQMGADEENHPALMVARTLFGMAVEDARRLRAEAEASMDVISTAFAIDTQPAKSASKKAPSAAESAAQASQKRLQEEVHATTMLSLAREAYEPFTNEDDLLTNILQSAHLLFEPRQVYLFEWDAQTNLISGRVIGEQSETIARIRLPLEPDRSLIADALLQNAMTHSFDSPSANISSMMDKQILRMAGAEAICCVPVKNQHFVFGVLVLAFHSSLHPSDGHLRFLSAFARQAADSVYALRNRMQNEALNASLQEKAFQLHARQVVHEANNPLAILKNYLRTLDLKLAESQPVTRELQILNEEIDRVAEIIRRFASPAVAQQDTGISKVEVNAVIQDMLAVCDRALFAPANIRVETQLDDQLPAISSNASQLRQVFVNLFKNAAEAMANGGTLRVTSALMVGPLQNESIVVSIADSGPGMPKEVMARLFSPVKSTKGSGNSGLGLSITANLLRELGGSINCRSAAGKGTAFEVHLPCVRDNPDRHALT